MSSYGTVASSKIAIHRANPPLKRSFQSADDLHRGPEPQKVSRDAAMDELTGRATPGGRDRG